MAGLDNFEVILRWAEGLDVPEIDTALARLDGPERRLAERVVELGRRHREFTQKLTHTAKLAEVGLAMAGLVHDMRQPLSAIAGFAQLLQDHPADAEAQAWVGEIRGQSTRLEQMIERLRRFVRNPDEPVEARADVSKATHEVVALFHKLPPSVALELEIAQGDLPLVRAEPGALVQVLFNLLANARDALEERGDGRILVRVETTGAGVRISVGDDGAGIPPELRSRLFQPFATSKGEAGTGLGLFICRQLVASWGGAIRLVEPAHAPYRTTFAIDLPAAGALPPAEARPATVAPSPSLAQLTDEMREALASERGTRRVLIVDDQAAMRRALRVLLADEPGLELLEAGDGAAAKALLAKAPALVLVEKSVAGASGIDILRWARERDLGLEAIVVTAQPSLQSALDALELGAADYLLKPIEPIDHLRGRVREAFTRQGRRLLLRALDAKARLWAERALAVGADGAPAAPLRSAWERLARRPEGPARFLVVADAQAAEQVALAGHRSESAVDVAHARVALLDNSFDALLIGAGTPAAGAFEITAQARAFPWPVLVVWGAPTATFDDAVRAIRAGASALVRRPIEPRTFAQALARLVRHGREETRALALERVFDALEVV